ncbi:HK97 family phage prohead protease [Ruminococcus sp.]|uniref:HK97 family phage prohead protease n=1 Tax=Ruminococcus sp. TaxID=41978 RepID=UPI003870AC0B
MSKSLFDEREGLRVLQLRSGEFKTRDDGGEPTIEGYFAVFNSNYEMWEGASESIAEGAFDSSISGDIRALTNHDTTLVLGRTTANTLELKSDAHGLWGRVRVNPKDSDAMNTYERVKRGDVSQCSIGFIVRSEETEFDASGNIHWTITDVDLFEVSVCTFPAYEETGISARKRDAAELEKRRAEAWRAQMHARLKNKQEENENA